MFDVLDDLEAAIDKVAADEGSVDVVRIWKLTERLDAQRLRAVGGFDRSGVWAAERFLSPAAAIRHKTRCSHGKAMRSVRLARKLELLSLVAGAFQAGEITREHVVEITGPYTPKRAAMLEGIEHELVEFARTHTPLQLRAAVQRAVDAFDHDDGASRDKAQHELNKVTLSLTTGKRGILNGSLDAELADIVLTALDAEMEVLRTKAETRTTPELRPQRWVRSAGTISRPAGTATHAAAVRPTSVWSQISRCTPTSSRSSSRPFARRPPTADCCPGPRWSG
jgi:hypothetical protein